MIKHWTLILIFWISTAFAFPVKPKVTIYLAGDSTMQTYSESKTPMRGWGQYLSHFFDNDKVSIVNKAIGGRSTRTFIDEARWQGIVEQLKKGDYVFIQFGHNDQSRNPARHTTPEAYRANIRKFIVDVREKEAFPVLLTPITMRKFDVQGKITNGLGVYPEIMREVAKEMDAPLIDLNKETSEYVERLGEEASKKMYMWLAPGEHPKYPEGVEDNTHLQEPGAMKVSELAVEGIKASKLKPLVRYLKE